MTRQRRRFTGHLVFWPLVLIGLGRFAGLFPPSPALGDSPAPEVSSVVRRTLFEAEQEPVPSERLGLLVQIAESQVKTGDRPGASQTVAKALKTAELITDPTRRAGALASVASVQAMVADRADTRETLRRAISLANSVPPEESPRIEELPEVYRTVAETAAKLGDRDTARDNFGRAISLAGGLPVTQRCLVELEWCAKSAARSEERTLASRALELARNVVVTLEKDTRAAIYLVDIAETAATTLGPDEAIRIVEEFPGRHDGTLYLILPEIILASKPRNTDTRRRILDRVVRLTQSLDSRFERPLVLKYVGCALARIGDFALARFVADSDVLRHPIVPDHPSGHRAAILAAIALARAEAGDREESLKAAQEVSAFLDRPKLDASTRSSLVLPMIQARAKLGDIEAARELFRFLEPCTPRIEASLAIAEAQLNPGSRKDVCASLQAAEVEATRCINPLEFRSRSIASRHFAEIARLYAKAGELNEAARVFEGIHEPSLDDINMIAREWTRTGDAKGAEAWALSFKTSPERMTALLAVAEELAAKQTAEPKSKPAP